jgi:hypothetical protein
MKYRAKILSGLVFVIVVALSLDSSRNTFAANEDPRFWAFQPVSESSPPVVRGHEQVQSPVDQFILARLEARGLGLSAAADRRTLLRRTTFDLTGLPPTLEEIAAFLADESPDAFARVVDRLLASPRYGERWGRHWLDVVRYADARDLIQLPIESDFREAWRYRDWVVNSFNRDLPYDQFLSLQIAGDLLQPADPARIDADALVATGLLAIADFVPGDVDKEQMIADYVNDQIDVVGRACLGLTLACARCHDHKFDPITTADYYSLAGIFFSTRLIPGPIKGNTPLVKVPLLSATEISAIEAEQVRDKARISELTRELTNSGEREYRAWLERQVATQTQRYLLAAWEFTHRPAVAPTQEMPSAVAEFAKQHELDATLFGRWISYYTERNPHPALQALRSAADKREATALTNDLVSQLAAAGTESPRRQLAVSPFLRLRADDRRVSLNEKREASLWPNLGYGPQAATTIPETSAPVLASAPVHGEPRPAFHFSGKELFQAEGTVPPVGTLFVVYRPDPAGPAGQRLIGWEDAAVGQHGLGIMTDAAGSAHVIARRGGANGDVVVPALGAGEAVAGFQLLSITWGPDGVAVFRNGGAVGVNKGIDSISSDPAITALRIGGPGSGGSARFQGDIAELRVYSVPLDEPARTRVEAELTRRWRAPADATEQTDEIAELYDELISASSPFRLEGAARDSVLPPDFRQRLEAARNELETLKKKPPPEIPKAVVVQEGGPADTPHAGFHDAKIFLRGNPAKLGPTVPRGFPKIIAGANPPEIREGSGRRELARWLTDPANPLTARVLVNRVWQHHFGVGLVATSANFGAQGERPSHPELLDYLAARLVASDWSIKSLHRLIMLSNVYQQSSEANPAGLAADPENRLLWRANRRRLESEALRDSLFAVAGRLDVTAGGPAFPDVSTPRRSLYLQTSRTGAKSAEFGPLFDAPDCSGIVERRTESIVAPQALFLLNDPLVTSLAQSLAARVKREVPAENDRERIVRLYEITLGRPPVAEELEVGAQFLAASGAASDAWTSYCRLIMSTNEFLYVD